MPDLSGLIYVFYAVAYGLGFIAGFAVSAACALLGATGWWLWALPFLTGAIAAIAAVRCVE